MKRPIIIALLIAGLVLVGTRIGTISFFTGRPLPFVTLEESKTIKVDVESRVKLKVNNAAGSVTIIGADVKTIQVNTVKTGHDLTQTGAEKVVKTIQYTIEQTGNMITIRYKLPNTDVWDINLNTVDFMITVPNETTVNVYNNIGEVGISNIKGDAIITNDFGEVKVDNIEGALSVSNNGGDVNASSIKASHEDIELNTDFGAVTLKNASGSNITLDSNAGTIMLQEVHATGNITTDGGNTSFENSSTTSLRVTNSGALTLKKVRASKEIMVQDDFGEIEVEQTTAAFYELHTNRGSIAVDGVKGNLKVSTDFGGINIQNAQSVRLDLKTKSGSVHFSGSLGEGPHTVESDFGEIVLTFPAEAKLNVDLKTDFGNIDSELPITVVTNGSSGSDGDQIIGSINGGGEQLTVQTNSGSININIGK